MSRIITPPVVAFGRETCGVLEAGLRREWLVTNGLGGYASGTLAGVLTRRYHGLLVAALSPPVARTVLVAGAVERAVYDGHTYPLSAHEFGGGVIEPRGYVHMQAFELDGQLPVWTFALGDALLERRVWMQHGANTTWLTWRLVRGALPVELAVTPLLTYRDFHTLTRAGAPPRISVGERDITVQAFGGAAPYRLLADSGTFQPHGDWWWNFHHREETARGLDDASDLYTPGAFTVTLHAGEQFALALTAEQDERFDADAALARERERQQSLLRAAVLDALPALQHLTLAADQFIVERRTADAASPTVIAGYHWFNDWGRDTLIALPGLTLATGRASEGAAILRAFAHYVSDGLLPNNFPDQAGQQPGYNSADAALWFAVALQRHYAATGDAQLVDELLPTLREIVDAHVHGTRFGIGVDPADGLLRAGAPGLQLTWMDAKVGDWVVTPRVGKPVELNALWHGTLRIVAEFLTRRGDSAAAALHNALADRAQASFRKRFIRPDLPQLADVVDGPDGDDWSVRPSQLLALSLPWPLLDGDAAARVLECVGRALLTTYGLRSLAPDNPAYQGGYGGAPLARDGAYHQGPVWTWLAGPYAEAHYRVHGDRAAALALLTPFAQHLRDAGLGSISEILDGDPPHHPRGAIAQAWGVAEVLRVWRLLLDAL